MITGGSSKAAMIFKLPRAVGAVINIDVEDPFEQPGPAHARRRTLGVRVIACGLGCLLYRTGNDFTPQLRVGREHAMEAEETGDRMLHFLRRDRGVSFHKFALAIKPAEELEVVSCKSLFSAERQRKRWTLLRPSLAERYEAYLRDAGPKIHPGFFKNYLDLIIRKA